MGIQHWKTVRVSKHAKVNLGLRYASVSLGKPGRTMKMSRRGARATIGLPGTGLSYATNQLEATAAAPLLVKRAQSWSFLSSSAYPVSSGVWSQKCQGQSSS